MRRVLQIAWITAAFVGCTQSTMGRSGGRDDAAVTPSDARIDVADAGVLGDAGFVTDMDAGVVDSGELDAGIVGSDGGRPARDAGPEVDAGFGDCRVGADDGVCIASSECTGDYHSVSGYCPGPPSIRCCLPGPPPVSTSCDPDVRVYPNAGIIEAAGDPGCPAGMVKVGTSLCVDQYEAFLEEVMGPSSYAAWSPYFSPSGHTVIARSAADAVPQGYISGSEAKRACEQAGKRLCSNTEWLRSCQGAEGNTYPYGDDRVDGICNDSRPRHPAVELFGASGWDLDSACINQLTDSLDPSGTNLSCVTSEGLYDMMGNLHEWTSDSDGTFRGGFYVDTVINGQGCLYRTTAHNFTYADYSTGFRCCADAAF